MVLPFPPAVTFHGSSPPQPLRGMKLSEYLSPERIIFTQATQRDAALGELANLLAGAAHTAPAPLTQAILERERLCSTGIGFGIAVPHVRTDKVDKLLMAVAVCRQPLEFNSLDGEPVHAIFMFAGHPQSHREYLKALSRVTSFCRQPEWRKALLATRDAAAVLRLLASD